MIKNICNTLFKIAVISIILLIIGFFVIKKDMADHFGSKLEREHEDYMKYHTTMEEKISYHGFKFEEHKIKTEDGYILTAFRIPGKIYEKENIKKRAVLINHGLLDASYTFLAHGENESLPFILVDKGFDVWLTNNRGTVFSYEHEDPKKDSFSLSSDYWDFSFHEMAKYDIVANINYVKNITKNEKVNYLCHSQGCTQFFIGYTFNPEFFEKNVEKVGTMGAVLSYKNINQPFTNVVKKLNVFGWLEYFGIKNVMSFHHSNIKAFGYLCRRALFICQYVIGSIVQNEDTKQIDWEAIQNMYYYQPGGSSVKNLMHWLQSLGGDQVRFFDYGPEKNKQLYGSEISPAYNFDKLEQMSIDIFITTTSGDPYCLKEDFKLMLKTFKNAKVVTKDVGNYNHLDYLWGKNAHIDIYQDMLKFLDDK